jgi:hypothetical protein
MKTQLTTLFLLLFSFTIIAQVSRTSVVEHFTNTSCSVCASRNGAIKSTISANPHTIHISFHPSSPYSNDIFNVDNRSENDARTNFYNIYGFTPLTIVNGVEVSNANFGNTLSSLSTTTSNFDIKINQTKISLDSIKVTAMIKKMSPDPKTSAMLFVAAIEDTVNRMTNNGESVHINVFRKTLTKIQGDSISLPNVVGDSVVFIYGYKIKSGWSNDRMEALGFLQDLSSALQPEERSIALIPGAIINAGRSVNTLLSALPVKFGSITVNENEGGHKIEWTTESEINASHFNIQHSENGEDFLTIGKVKAVGNSVFRSVYFINNAIQYSGYHYYRIEEVDIDGTKQYSKIIAIESTLNKEKVIIHPNPTNGLVKFSREVSGISIYDAFGRKLGVWNSPVKEVNISAFEKGIYFISYDGSKRSLIVLN